MALSFLCYKEFNMDSKEVGVGVNSNVIMLISMCIYTLEEHAKTWAFSSYGAFKHVGTNHCSFHVLCKNHDEMLLGYAEHDAYSNRALSVLLVRADHMVLCPEIFIKLPDDTSDLLSIMPALQALLSAYQSGELLEVIRKTDEEVRKANDGKAKVLEFEFDITEESVALKLSSYVANNAAEVIGIATFRR